MTLNAPRNKMVAKLYKFVGVKTNNKYDLEKIIETSFEMADIEPEDVEFRKHITYIVTISSHELNQKEFINGEYLQQKELAEAHANAYFLHSFLQDVPEERKEYYQEKMIAFFRAFIALNTQSKRPTRDEYNVLIFLRDEFRNKLFIAPDDEVAKKFKTSVDRITEYFKEVRSDELISNQIEVTRHQKTLGKWLPVLSLFISVGALCVSLWANFKPAKPPQIYLMPGQQLKSPESRNLRTAPTDNVSLKSHPADTLRQFGK